MLGLLFYNSFIFSKCQTYHGYWNNMIYRQGFFYIYIYILKVFKETFHGHRVVKGSRSGPHRSQEEDSFLCTFPSDLWLSHVQPVLPHSYGPHHQKCPGCTEDMSAPRCSFSGLQMSARALFPSHVYLQRQTHSFVWLF